MTNKLEKKFDIDAKRLDRSQYFLSLLKEAAHCGSIGNVGEIRRNIVQLVEEMAVRYTFGASSSVRIETAQQMMTSAVYSIGYALKAMPDTDTAVLALKQKTVNDLFREGKVLIRSDVRNAKHLLEDIQNNAIATENRAYNDTVRTGLPAFFSAYDVDYAAHETPGSIDYPIDMPSDPTGIDYIYGYLKRLAIEERFCAYYDAAEIEALLRGYSKEYRDLLVNIFDRVLTNAVGRVLCGRSAAGLDLRAFDREQITRTLCGMDEERMNTVMQGAAGRICQDLNITDGAIRTRMRTAINQVSVRIKNVIETRHLDKELVSLKENAPAAVHFTDSNKMDDEAFRAVTEEIRACRYTGDKCALIARYIHSVADLADMLGASCLYGDEYDDVFKTLDDMALALLYRNVGGDEIHVSAGDLEWHHALECYLEINSKTDHIRELAETIELC